jgi:hypothetical protein
MNVLRRSAIGGVAAILALGLAGCETGRPYDYTAFQQNPPRSILVLPPLNESLAVEATYGYYSTVTRPLAERGYYVFPLVIVDRLLQENGMPTAGEMHDVPLAKVREVTGADAVLYPVVHNYGTKYHLVSSDTVVEVSARLVDTRTGTLLWDGNARAVQGSGGSGSAAVDVVAALVSQVLTSTKDQAHGVSRTANEQLFFTKRRELPHGPYSPEYGRIP